MQVPTTWQGIPGQPQLPAQQIAAPSAALQQPGLVFPIQQYQVNIFNYTSYNIKYLNIILIFLHVKYCN